MREIELTPISALKIESGKTMSMGSCTGFSGKDILPEFSLREGRVIVMNTYNSSEFRSKAKGTIKALTSYFCPLMDYKKLLEVYERTGSGFCPHAPHILLSEMAQYGTCGVGCGNLVDYSNSRTVAKISGNVHGWNGYGAINQSFVFFAVIKKDPATNEPLLYVRRRPANKRFMAISAEDYEQEYVRKNKHDKNSFCICLYTPPKLEEKPRAIEV